MPVGHEKFFKNINYIAQLLNMFKVDVDVVRTLLSLRNFSI